MTATSAILVYLLGGFFPDVMNLLPGELKPNNDPIHNVLKNS
jgi:hypothetical protein